MGVVTYFVQTRWGGSERAPTVERLREVLTELERPDPEHPDVWLTHESGWTLSVYGSGLLVWENPESTIEPRHQVGVPREAAGVGCEIVQVGSGTSFVDSLRLALLSLDRTSVFVVRAWAETAILVVTHLPRVCV